MFRSELYGFPVHPDSLLLEVVTYEELDRRLNGAELERRLSTVKPNDAPLETPLATPASSPPPQCGRVAAPAPAVTTSPAIVAAKAAVAPAVVTKARVASPIKAAASAAPAVSVAPVASAPAVSTAAANARASRAASPPVAGHSTATAGDHKAATAAAAATGLSVKHRGLSVSTQFVKRHGEAIESLWDKTTPATWLVLKGAAPGMYTS